MTALPALLIANTQIRRDRDGRYCLNDLHQASGGHKRHQPGNWLRLDQTKALIAEIGQFLRPTELKPESGELEPASSMGPKSEEGLLRSEEAPLVNVNDGFGNGTYATKALVYAYAMWISPKFHLHVIEAYDALVQEQPTKHDGLATQQQIVAMANAVEAERRSEVRAALHGALVMFCEQRALPVPSLAKLARQRLPRRADPAHAAAFWQAITVCAAAGARVDHSRNPAVRAYNLPQLRLVAESHGQPLPDGLALGDALRADPRFVATTAVNSALSGRTVKAWLFWSPEPNAL